MKTKQELERDGQYRSDRHRSRPPEGEALSLHVTGRPELLASNVDDLAQVAFNALIEALPEGTVGLADSMSLTVLASTWSRWVMIGQRMNEYAHAPESNIYNRLFRQVMELEKQIRQFSGEFGLTPRSRTQIKLSLQQAAAEKSPTEELEGLRDALSQD